MTKEIADRALEGYFDDLLHESQEVGLSAPKKRVAPKPKTQQTPQSTEQQLVELEEQKRERLQKLLAQQTLIKVPESSVETKADASPKTEVETKFVEAPAKTTEEVEVAEQEHAQEVEPRTEELNDKLLAWGENGRPLWAQSAFDVLLFEVHGLSLAVPLIALGQIVPLDKKLTRLHKQSDWFMGILPSSVGDIRTINTALFVMPERYQESYKDAAKYVVTIDGLPWGLAVDSVKQPISLQPDDVKWRSERSKRPWLAGTVKSQMCALIDIPQMAELLARSDTTVSRSR